MAPPPRQSPNPDDICTVEDFVAAFAELRTRAARGSGRARVSLDDIADRSGVPRSTVHVYLSGRSRPTPDALDAMLQALDVSMAELGRWSEALERVEQQHASPAHPVPR